MKYFYDTEFIDDGRMIDLISIGIVAEDGREYYAVSYDFDERKLHRHRWLMENVASYLPLRSDGWLDYADPSVKGSLMIVDEIHEFLTSDGLVYADRKNRELWAWYGAYDHVYLAQLWGPMADLPPGVLMFTCDLKQEHVQQGCPELPTRDTKEHHALADARYNMEIAKTLGVI